MPQPDWLSLPVEIWLFLCARLRPRDLAELCRTCSQLLLITRPILYRTLNLAAEKNRKPNEVVKYTFSLLARDRELAQSVRELTLNSSSSSEAYFRNHRLVDLASMQNMTQVKRLTITGDISRHAGVQTWTVGQLVQMLHDWNLDELRFPAPGACEFFLLCNNAQLIQLANAKRIVLDVWPWVDYNYRLLPHLECMLTAASPSLTSLSLRAPPRHLVMLFKLRFPHLRSLAVTRLWAHSPRLTSPDFFNAFISAHHQTLEELHLVYDTIKGQRLRGPCAADAIVFNEGGIKLMDPDFLPNLRVLRAYGRTVEEMARARMRCLSKLSKLFIASNLVYSGKDERLRDICRMLDALKVATAGRLALTEFDFRFFLWQAPERDFIPDFVHQIGMLCGTTLEVWHGLLPYAGSWPLDVFAAFTRLRIIDFPQDERIMNVRSDEALENVRGLSGICSTLEEIRLVGFSDVEDSCWIIDRRSVLGTTLIRVSCSE